MMQTKFTSMCQLTSKLILSVMVSLSAFAADTKALDLKPVNLKPGDLAPNFSLLDQDGATFQLSSRKGKWTVLYFYPKSETPGCTKQACAFRDGIDKIRALNAEVYGVSVNTVKDQLSFKQNHQLNFPLLADADAKVTELYGASRGGVKMANRWTLILDPELKIREINKDVDPVKDAIKVTESLKEFQKKF